MRIMVTVTITSFADLRADEAIPLPCAAAAAAKLCCRAVNRDDREAQLLCDDQADQGGRPRRRGCCWRTTRPN